MPYCGLHNSPLFPIVDLLRYRIQQVLKTLYYASTESRDTVSNLKIFWQRVFVKMFLNFRFTACTTQPTFVYPFLFQYSKVIVAIVPVCLDEEFLPSDTETFVQFHSG